MLFEFEAEAEDEDCGVLCAIVTTSWLAALKYTGFKKESTISVVEREKGQEMGCRFY